MERRADHTIRLHGPWQYSVVTRSTKLSEIENREETRQSNQGSIHIPADWAATLGSDFRGRVRYSRNFGKPTGLEANDRVELVCDCVDAFGSVELNGATLGNIQAGLRATRFDITQFMKPRNQLNIEVEVPQDTGAESPLHRPGREQLAGGIIGEVRLEIFTSKQE